MPVTLSQTVPTLSKNELVELASTDVALGISGVWASDFLDVEEYLYIRGGVNADVVGTLQLLYSADGINTLFIQATAYIIVSDGLGFKAPVLTPYIKIQYTNGGTAQTSFSLYAYGGA